MNMELVAAVDNNWAIGNQNKLLVRIPNDMRAFQALTMGHVVILGRKTLETFPKAQPLKGRLNIILSTDPRYKVEGAVVVHSVDELLEFLDKNKEKQGEFGIAGKTIFVIGGESIYRQLLPYCNVAHLTKIDYEFEADAFFPNLDATGEWKMQESGEEETYFDLEYSFCKYVRL